MCRLAARVSCLHRALVSPTERAPSPVPAWPPLALDAVEVCVVAPSVKLERRRILTGPLAAGRAPGAETSGGYGAGGKGAVDPLLGSAATPCRSLLWILWRHALEPCIVR